MESENLNLVRIQRVNLKAMTHGMILFQKFPSQSIKELKRLLTQLELR